MGLLERLDVYPRVEDGIGFMRLKGRLVAETRHEIRAAIREWEQAGEPIHVIALMGGVEYLDSAGMAALIGLWKHQQELKGELVIAELNPRIESLFQVTSLGRFLKTFETVADAVKHLKGLGKSAKGKAGARKTGTKDGKRA